MSRILLVRHGQIKPKADDRHFGHTDFPLDAVGIEQATRLRNKLVKESIKKIYTSDLIRTIRTAELATSGFGIPVIKCPELREIDFGSVEGMTYDDIIKDYPDTNQIWTGSDVNKKFPGGESLKDLGKRISSFMKRLDGENDTILVVAHGGSLRVLACMLLNIDISRWWQLRLSTASLTVMETSSGGAILNLFNDCGHLEA